MNHKQIFLALLFLFPLKTLAAGYTTLQFMYISEDRGVEGSSQQVSRTLIDFGVGKIWGNGFTLGIKYGSEQNEYPGGSMNRTGLGASAGWMKSKSQGFYIMGTYYINPSLSGGYKGKGTQADIGYRFALDKVSIGPQLSQKNFVYDEVDGMSISPAYKDSRVDPYFTVWIDF